MFADEARGDLPMGTAKRWAHHTPDISKLPEHKFGGGAVTGFERGGRYEVHPNLDGAKMGGPDSKSMVRCPSCDHHFFAGGSVSPDKEALEYAGEHREELGMGERTRAYDKEFHHYYGEGEAGFKDKDTAASFASYLAKRRSARGSRGLM